MIRRIAVVVPAADEQDTVAACLQALTDAAAQVDCAVRIVVVLDACADATASVVAGFPAVGTVTSSARNVGAARRLGTAEVLRGEQRPEELLLASTDADSRVPTDWLTGLVRTSRHADLVLGTVVPEDGLAPDVATAWLHRHDLRDGHAHVHAANLAIRADAYLAIGGWQPLAAGEDEDLVARAVAAGLRVHRSAAHPVRTSTRAFGRAPRGFSSYLRALGHV